MIEFKLVKFKWDFWLSELIFQAFGLNDNLFVQFLLGSTLSIHYFNLLVLLGSVYCFLLSHLVFLNFAS